MSDYTKTMQDIDDTHTPMRERQVLENNDLFRTAARLSHKWQNLQPAKFCAQWDTGDWIEFISECESKGLDPDAECMRLYEEQGDF